MTKAELCRAIAQKTGLQIKETTEVLEAFIDIVQSELTKGEKVTLRGFGTFKKKHRPERKARNLSNGTEVVVPARDVVHFIPSSQFFEEIN